MVWAWMTTCLESWVVGEEQGKFWRISEMRFPGSACRRLEILCRRRVGGGVGLLAHAASRSGGRRGIECP